ncbi:hypothetical protein TGAM01_v210919 [Trichoderma gamsii]|uniref:Autophagy-related protein 1 n=1 Tax=Trichoderma gamsii TaxID=398673 RepID=A0A2P4Z7C9_9HYPO|nr:hypothetical protein TGAM01_v210919 [Trichoderma gamsii]PON20198.1 hypothetical protein TGAM01_v210919 [Trichoderma gamsii]
MASPTERTSLKIDMIGDFSYLFANEISERLTTAIQDREEATPEPIYADPTVKPCYQLICEQKRAHFESAEAEKIRQLISKREYWELEAKFLKAAAEQCLQKVRNDPLEYWRTCANGWGALLKGIGIPLSEIYKIRKSIDVPFYWKSESELFEREAKRQEMELRELWKAQARRQVRRTQQTTKTQRPLRNTKSRAADYDPASRHFIVTCWLQHLDPPTLFDMMPDVTDTSLDYSDIVLFLGHFTQIDNVVELTKNARYVFKPPMNEHGPNADWLGGGCVKRPKTPVLYLAFGQSMSSPDGWVCGSATGSVDIQLAPDNTTGISKRHFRIDIEPATHHPRVTCLGQSLQVTIGDHSKPTLLTRDDAIEIPTWATFDLGGVAFQAWRPKLLPTALRAYKKKSLEFSLGCMNDLPTYFPAIENDPETITSNVRYGKTRVYVKQDIEARGATASVMLVLDRDTGEQFAAKEPYYKSSDNDGIRRKRYEELKREYEHSTSFDHPHIVRAYEVVRAKDPRHPPWLILPWIPTCLDPKKLREQDIIVFSTQILSAIAFLHSRDTTHRDLKPDNILMQDGDFKLADFGTTCRQVQPNMDTFTGSPLYLAPEILEQPRSYTSKVDMFSFGLVLLQCVSEWDPLSDSDGADSALDASARARWMHKVILPHIEEASERFRPLLRGLLRKRPEDRWSALWSLAWLSRNTESLETKENLEPDPQDPHTSPKGRTDFDEETVRGGKSKRRISALSSGDCDSMNLHRAPSWQPKSPVLGEPQNSSHGDSPDPTAELPSTLPWEPYSHEPIPPSPSWAPTPARDEGEFPTLEETEEFMDISHVEFAADWIKGWSEEK